MEYLWLEVLVYQADCFRGKEVPVADDRSLDQLFKLSFGVSKIKHVH